VYVYERKTVVYVDVYGYVYVYVYGNC